jgi:NAD(P)H-dependent flavin oxidoreductase YrpB (nitropropane dioxygenase family)
MSEETSSSIEAILEDVKHYEMTYKGDIENGAVLLGQSIGIINNIENVSQIIDNIVRGAEEILKKAPNLIK